MIAKRVLTIVTLVSLSMVLLATALPAAAQGPAMVPQNATGGNRTANVTNVPPAGANVPPATRVVGYPGTSMYAAGLSTYTPGPTQGAPVGVGPVPIGFKHESIQGMAPMRVVPF